MPSKVTGADLILETPATRIMEPTCVDLCKDSGRSTQEWSDAVDVFPKCDKACESDNAFNSAPFKRDAEELKCV